MGFFDKAMKTVQNVGGSVTQSVKNVGSSASVAVQDNSELNNMKSQINVINQELDAAYIQIGKKYVDYVQKTGDMGNLNVTDILTMIDPKLQRKAELEAKIIELEKQMQKNALLRDKAQAEKELQDEITKLDKALTMEVITKEEYDYKVSIARKKVDNFEEIKRVEQQYEMGIITKEERNAKIESLTQ